MFLYYLPNQTRPPKPEEFAEIGIDHAFETAERHTVPSKGPDGSSGMIVAPNPGDIGYYPDRQLWRKAIGLDYWVGMPRDWQPKPGDLARRSMLDGLEVKLTDDQLWLIPRARQYNGNEDAIQAFVTLPHSLDAGDDGEVLVGPVLRKWEFLQSIADDFYDFHHRQENEEADKRFDFDGIVRAACEVIGANYRLRGRECFMLGLLCENSAIEILRALIDDDSLRFLIDKKKEALASSASFDGREDSTEVDTSQRSPTP